MVYKYVSLGLNPTHTSGKVSWFHDECALKMNVVAGGHPFKTDEVPPKDARCYSCGKEFFGEAFSVKGFKGADCEC